MACRRINTTNMVYAMEVKFIKYHLLGFNGLDEEKRFNKKRFKKQKTFIIKYVSCYWNIIHKLIDIYFFLILVNVHFILTVFQDRNLKILQYFINVINILILIYIPY